MTTFGDLAADPARVGELEGADILVLTVGGKEVVVQNKQEGPEATMVFQHETIAMMQAERAERLDKLRGLLNQEAPVLPLRKNPGSLWDHITVGRASTADIVLDDPAISNVHAHFAIDDDNGAVSVQDVGSSNGTFINRVRLQPHEEATLQSGDCVRFGQTILYYVSQKMLKELLGA